jgi:hypothetical protein
MSESATPESGPLSVEQAIAAITPPVEQETAPEAPVEAAEGEPTEGAASAPEEAEGEAETPAEAEETEAEAGAVEPADPPTYWSKDAKEAFGQLSPELQAVVLAQEGPREEAAAKAKADAAAVRQQADAEMGKVTQLAETLADFLPQAIQKFSHQYGTDPDWVKFAEEYGAEAMTLAKARHDADLADLQKLAVATQEAQTQAHQAYVKAELAKLAEIAPHLADPEKGVERRQDVVKYLKSHGSTDDEIRNISAAEMLIAHKAKLWDDAQAALKTAPKPKPALAPAQRSPVRPAAGTAQSPERSALQQAQARFNLNPSRENAEALLLAKG